MATVTLHVFDSVGLYRFVAVCLNSLLRIILSLEVLRLTDHRLSSRADARDLRFLAALEMTRPQGTREKG
jgi:hypothetical protein